MSPYAVPSQRQTSIGLLVLRIVLGIIFVMHGGQKLFVYGLDGAAGAFAGMGIPAPAVTAALVSLVEFLGGFALIAGLLTRLTGLGLAITMLGAIGFAHLGKFFAPEGFEFPLALLAASVALMFAGAGELSVDAVLARKRR